MKKFLNVWDDKTLMTLLTSSTLLAASSAFAGGGVTVETFSVVRTGGGQIEVSVQQKGEQITAFTKSCSFKQLADADQEKTSFILTGKEAADAAAILNNTETLASNESIHNPYLLGGTWSGLTVTYSYALHDGSTKTEVKSIQAPIVLINGSISTVLSDVETQARAASTSVCK